jgi:protein-L-isoaspartate(D-aspartate) O-methyltransferase
MAAQIRNSAGHPGIGMTSQRTRARMVERLREQGIRDERVLGAMAAVPRHLFVEEALASRAYEDTALPIGFGQTISQPYVVARMIEFLIANEKSPGKALEVGTGCGYQAAVLAQLAARVCTVERIPKLAAHARETLEAIGATNVWVRTANGTFGWPDEAPFDRIVVTAGGPAVPPPLFEQLAEGGRLVMPVGSEDSQRLQVVDKISGLAKVTEDSGCVFVKLIGKYAWEG